MYNSTSSNTDRQLIEIWRRRSNSEFTRLKNRWISSDVLFSIDRPLRQFRLEDLQDYQDILKDLAQSTQADILGMILIENKPRNLFILLVGYAGGLRVSVLVALTWNNVISRSDRLVQLSDFGKSGESRDVLQPSSVSNELCSFREDTSYKFPVFASLNKGDAWTRQHFNNFDVSAFSA